MRNWKKKARRSYPEESKVQLDEKKTVWNRVCDGYAVEPVLCSERTGRRAEIPD